MYTLFLYKNPFLYIIRTFSLGMAKISFRNMVRTCTGDELRFIQNFIFPFLKVRSTSAQY